jgi:hypothetical protein
MVICGGTVGGYSGDQAARHGGYEGVVRPCLALRWSCGEFGRVSRILVSGVVVVTLEMKR